MKREWLKIGSACFVSAVVCFLLCVFLAPAFKFFGALAGLMAGYVAYEFREVLRAIPQAFRAALRGAVVAWDWLIAQATRAISWLTQPHPRTYGTILPTLLSMYLIREFFVLGVLDVTDPVFIWVHTVLLSCVVFESVAFGILLPVNLGVEYLGFFIEGDISNKESIQKKLASGLLPAVMSYGNCVRWWGIGCWIMAAAVFKFLFVTMWVGLAKGVATVAVFCCRFVVELVKIIHTYKRLLCAVDGTLGGLWAWVYLSSVTHTLPEHLVVACIGGMVGAFLGILNYEIVSVRLWKLNGVPVQS